MRKNTAKKEKAQKLRVLKPEILGRNEGPKKDLNGVDNALLMVTESIRGKSLAPIGGRFAALYANVENALESEYDEQEQLGAQMVQIAAARTDLMREGLRVAVADLTGMLKQFKPA
jgi:hypothetical protein